MKINFFLVCTFVLSSFSTYAQKASSKAPNYKKIEKNISKEGQYLYSSLLTRFLEGDTTMTLEQKRHLYYGYTFQDAYSPYGRSDYLDSLKPLYEKGELDTSDFYQLIYYTDQILQEDMFDMNAMMDQMYAHDFLGNLRELGIRQMQYFMVIDVLLSSGSGSSEKEAIYVINTSHEYEFLSVVGLQFGGEQQLIKHFDYLTVQPNEYGIEGMYFDVTPCLNHLNLMFK